MNICSVPTRIRHVVLSALVLFTLGVGSLPTGSARAGVALAVPTVGDLVVDSYDCDTGELDFHAPVTILSAVDPETTALYDYPLLYAFGVNYGPEAGHQVFSGLLVWTPSAEQSPYSGIANLEGVAPPMHDGEAIASIEFEIVVGTGDTLNNFTDNELAIYHPDCDTPDDDLVQQLVDLLIQILQDILNG